MFIIKEKLFKDFIDIKNILNINILKCYKSLFCIKGIKNNIGSPAIISIILFHIISIFIFYKCQLVKIEDKINGIIFEVKIKKLVKNTLKEKSRKEKSLINRNLSTTNIQNKKSKNMNKSKLTNFFQEK